MNEPYPFRGRQPSEIRMTYTFKCNMCGETSMQEVFGEFFQPPEWPTGWRQLSDRWGISWICPKHKASVTIDGKEMPLNDPPDAG